jgi:Tol biopolymer transport system component
MREETTEGKAISQPVWTNDGEYIFYNLIPLAGGFSEIYVASVADNGHTQSKFFDYPIPSRDVSISPDGGWIAFEGWPEPGDHDIWLATITGEDLTQLTADSALDFDPAWKP